MSKPQVYERSFTNYLESLVENSNSGALASLRRGVGKPPGSVAQADRYVFCRLWEDIHPWDVDRYYLIATLFALWYQGKSELVSVERDQKNLGVSMRKMVDRMATERPREEVEKSVEVRFMALLNSHRDDLLQHLRHNISLLKANEVPVDWTQLLHDIGGWNLDSRCVQRSWARMFWVGKKTEKETPEESEINDNSADEQNNLQGGDD